MQIIHSCFEIFRCSPEHHTCLGKKIAHVYVKLLVDCVQSARSIRWVSSHVKMRDSESDHRVDSNRDDHLGPVPYQRYRQPNKIQTTRKLDSPVKKMHDLLECNILRIG